MLGRRCCYLAVVRGGASYNLFVLDLGERVLYRFSMLLVVLLVDNGDHLLGAALRFFRCC